MTCPECGEDISEPECGIYFCLECGWTNNIYPATMVDVEFEKDR